MEIEYLKYKVRQERVGDSRHKINVLGSARCIARKADFSYDQRGFTALSYHKLGYFCLFNNLLFESLGTARLHRF